MMIVFLSGESISAGEEPGRGGRVEVEMGMRMFVKRHALEHRDLVANVRMQSAEERERYGSAFVSWRAGAWKI
jgi:hypothetical protein